MLRQVWVSIACLWVFVAALQIVISTTARAEPAAGDGDGCEETVTAAVPSAIAKNVRDHGQYAAVETKLRPFAQPLLPVRPGDWLEKNTEPGQTFAEYIAAKPIRRSAELSTLYVCELGSFSPEQAKILAITYEYLRLFFDVPVKVHKRIPLAEIPAGARRTTKSSVGEQLEVYHLLERVLKPERPADALAYIAFTPHDLWPETKPPERRWNYVFGMASLRDRVGVWSMARFGDPARGEAERKFCLTRTLGTATHETGHILTMQHCTAFNCNMCGANSNEEGDRHPLHFCPVCLRKLCWNLGVEPVPYLNRLEAFCRKHGLDDDAAFYEKGAKALAK